jgi:hypothetical protein
MKAGLHLAFRSIRFPCYLPVGQTKLKRSSSHANETHKSKRKRKTGYGENRNPLIYLGVPKGV